MRPFAELNLTEAEGDAFLARMNARVSPEDYQFIAGMTHALPELLTLVEGHPATLAKLQHLLFGAKTEQTGRVCPAPAAVPQALKPRRKGHGRIKAQDYTGAHWVEVPHPNLKPGCLRLRPPVTSWHGCAATPVGRCSPPRCRRQPARKSTRRAWR
jgi:hypothetical protein